MAKTVEKADKARPFWYWADPRDPRTAVLSFLIVALIFGGGRKLLQSFRARRNVAALEGPDPSTEEVEAASEHGRSGLIELFRLLGTAEKPEVRDAAGRALSVLWARDEMIPEEEKALVRRGFAVNWRARRRYPRSMKRSIPIEATFGVPFLVEGGDGVKPTNLVWSYRVLGARRAGLEVDSAWVKGAGLASFEVEPTDFTTLGPHRLALAAKVRVVGLTDEWEIELPQIPFSFEFDPILGVDALLTSLDESRTPDFERAVRLEPAQIGLRHLEVSPTLVLRDPPELVVTTPLASDLAHLLDVEFEGVPGRFRAGQVVVSGQSGAGAIEAKRFPIGEIVGLPPEAIDRPGECKLRVILTADPDLGWADPDIRSLWPGTITTGWVTAEVIRR
jgi:hypothetical protein